jgi:hypothetical protein
MQMEWLECLLTKSAGSRGSTSLTLNQLLDPWIHLPHGSFALFLSINAIFPRLCMDAERQVSWRLG